MTTQKTIDFELICAHCSADLRGCGLHSPCPSCGNAVGDTINTSVVDSETLNICDDVPCVACGYNLRTLALDASCPECAERVVISLSPDDLRFASPRWLKRVRLGVGMLVLGAAFTALACWILWLLPYTQPSVVRSPWQVVAFYVIPCGALAALVMGPVGVFLVTWPDPNPRTPNLSIAPRLVARGCSLGLAISIILVTASGTTSLTLNFVNWLLFETVFVCTVLSLRSLATRARRSALARQAAVLIWALLVLTVIVIVLGSLSLTGPPIGGWLTVAYVLIFVRGAILGGRTCRMLTETISASRGGAYGYIPKTDER